LKLIYSIIILSSLLTPRWFEINAKALNHPIQSELKNDLFNHSFRNYVIAAGRRSFKTERFAKRFIIRECLKNSDKNYYIGAPTLQQSKEIFWEDLKRLAPSWAVTKINESDKRITFKDNVQLKVIGLKEFKRVQGQLMHGIVISEYQDCDAGVYNESIEPMINDTRGWCIKEGRPFGKNHFYDDYLKGVKGEKGWKSYHWTSEDILSSEQIDEAKRNLSLPDYEREYKASFESQQSLPYYAYSHLNNKKIDLNPNQPFILTCDFNATVKPMSWVLGQRVIENGIEMTYWKKSFQYQYTNTETMCEVVDKYFTETKYPNEIHLYGDYAGTQDKSNSSYTDWQIIENYFRNKAKIKKFIKPCKSVRNTIGATNAQLLNAKGERRQFVDPNDCKELIKDWEYCVWETNGMKLKEYDEGESAKLGHLCRAVDYYNEYEYSLKGKPIVRIENAF